MNFKIFAGMSHLQKQRLMNKYDGNVPFSAGNQTRMHNNPSQFSVEDDLGANCKFFIS
jgi:hypothetical protein